MKIVIIPSGFKECLEAEEVASAIDKGIRRFDSAVDTHVIPMVDGGEGFVKTIIKIKKGELKFIDATNPVGEKVQTYFGLYEENNVKTAVIEMAAIAGLRMVPLHKRNPLNTHTYGVGELILAALDSGATHILFGCGDSGTSDGGAGMAQALGAKFLSQNHQPIEITGGGCLSDIAYMDLTNIDPRLSQVQMHVACNWHNVLCGPKGVAHVFAPQKGASLLEVEILANGLSHFANLIEKATGHDVKTLPGSGASGGLGAGLVAFAGAKLFPRYEIIMKYIQIEEHLEGADLVLTAEGCIDRQTPNGKIPAEVARLAKQLGIPVIAITGSIGKDAWVNYTSGIDAYMSIIQKPTSLEKAMEDAANLIADCAEAAVRQIQVGYRIAERKLGKGII
ncbi:glycerate kinase family protein [Cytobacillus kochii]|uniref:glycerate kinase family protein n=1 Tax=Cytobacillus kochii TaxID=859143 RepID=UPI00203FB162|nr:glycerate kinase [Cytobacillus kochii]MCM3322578.1 glycerate kinase [Cytobacillus kochii]MCM3344943.1 glycerate kinase [Cytobacillus kochii]